MRWVLAVPRTRRSSGRDLAGRTVATELVEVTRATSREGRAGRGRVLLGRDRDQAAGAGRRHRRGHRDRALAARPPSAHHRRGARVDHAAHRQPRLLGANRPSATSSKTSPSCCGGALEAQGRVGLMLNVRRGDLEGVLAVLPALNQPTVSTAYRRRLGGPEHSDRGASCLGVVPQLKAAGPRASSSTRSTRWWPEHG